MKEYGEKIPEEKKKVIEDALAELKKAHEAKDLAAIDTHTEALNTAWQAASQDIYQEQQGEAGELKMLKVPMLVIPELQQKITLKMLILKK